MVLTADEAAIARWRICRTCKRLYDRTTDTRLPDGFRRKSPLNAPTGQQYGLCSAACRRVWKNRQARERREKRAPRHRVICGACGEEFIAKRADAKYCSTKCRVAGHRSSRR